MEMKKSWLILASLFGIILTLTLVSAQNLPNPPITSQQFVSFFSNLLVGVASGTEDVVARLLLFLLLTIVLYKPAEKITGGSQNLGLLLAAVVSLIGIRVLSMADITGLLLPSAALAVVISVFAPVALLAGFLMTSDLPKTLRQSAWWFFSIAFILLWYFRWTTVGDIAYVYLFGTIACVLGAILDGTIMRWQYKAQIQRGQATNLGVALEVSNQERMVLQKELAVATTTAGRKAILQRIKDLDRDMTDVLQSSP